MSLLTFPPSPSDGQIYPAVRTPGQTQYVWESATQTWRILRAPSDSGVSQLIAGSNITLSPPDGIGIVTVSATGGGGGGVNDVRGTLPIVVGGTASSPLVSINLATPTTSGAMSAADKTKLNGLVNYVLPVATSTVLGGVKDGANVTIAADGTISVANASTTVAGLVQLNNTNTAEGNITQAATANQIWFLQEQIDALGGGSVVEVQGSLPIVVSGTNSLPIVGINVATTTTAGSMSAADKVKLNSLTNYVLPVATSGILGGVKDGANVSVAVDGTLSVANASITTPGVVQLNDTNTAEGNTTQAATANQIWFLQEQINTLSGGGIAQIQGTLPIVISGTNTLPIISINNATPATAGALSAADKTKLDNIPTSYTFLNWDDISPQFNGVQTTFALRYLGAPKGVVDSSNIQVILGGVFQTSADAYIFSTSTTNSSIQFTAPPPIGLTFAAFSVVAAL